MERSWYWGPVTASMETADLAPGDRRPLRFDPHRVRSVVIDRADDPLAIRCYDRLWEEFGERGEMELREVIERRFRWPTELTPGARSFLYEMVAVLEGDSLIAVRDQSAIVAAGRVRAAVVHLSHVWIDPTWRGTGLAGWLRALPIETARRCSRLHGGPEPARVTLVAEMEHPEGGEDVARRTRLRAYEAAGFSKIDPKGVSYQQPDFRSPEVIDRDGVKPIPLSLIVRRVGLEYETVVSTDEVREIVTALYSMYSLTNEERHMAPLWASLASYPPPGGIVPLVPPTR